MGLNLPEGFRVVSTPAPPMAAPPAAAAAPAAAPVVPPKSSLPPGFKVISQPTFKPGKGTGNVSTNVEYQGKPLAFDGAGNNFTAGLNNAIYSTLGLPEYVGRGLINAPIVAKNFITGQPLGTDAIQPGGVMSREWISDRFEQIGVHDPDKTVANNVSDQLFRLAGEGAGMVIAPEMAVAALARAGLTGTKATAFLQALAGDGATVGGMVKNATIGSVANVAGVKAAEAVPEPYKPLVMVAAGVPAAIATHGVMEGTKAVVKGAGKAISDTVAPLHQGGRERLAGEQLTAAASDPQAVMSAIADPEAPKVPGSQPTTFQQTGDMGLGGLERAAAAKNPVEFQQRRAEQNAARVSATEGLQRTGAPETVISSVRSHLADIDKSIDDELAAVQARTQASTTAARQSAEDGTTAAVGRARTATEALGEGMAPADAGDAVRQAYEGARANAKTRERAIWRAVDPDHTLELPARGTVAGSARISAEIPSTARPPEGEEAAILQVAASLPETVSLDDMTGLQSRIKAALREERMANGESPAYRRLAQMNEAVQNDLETAVAAVVAREEKAVAAGTMRVEDTIQARFETYANDYFAVGETQPLARAGNGGRPVPAEGAPAAPGVRQDAGQPGLRPSARAGSDGAPAGNFDEAALGRLNEARATTKSRVETFDNKTLAPLRKRPSTTSPYDVSAPAVPGKIFHPGPASTAKIQQLRNAVGDEEALKNLEGYAVDRLRRSAMREDGTLDPAKAETWRRNHSDALEAFPELDQKIRATVAAAREASETAAKGKADVAIAEKAAVTETKAAEKTAKATRDEESAGTLGKLAKSDGPEEVVHHVGAVFGRADAAAEFARLRRATKGDPAALEGLRKSVVDFIVKKFVSNAEAGTSGTGAIKSDAFQTFIRDNAQALRAAGFTADEIKLMQNVAADLRQANRSIVAVKLPGGSNTVQDGLASKALGEGATSMLLKILVASTVTGGGASLVTGPLIGVPVGIATAVFSALREQGLRKVDDLVTKALLDPELALQLMKKVRKAEAPVQAKGLIAALSPTRLVQVLKGESEQLKRFAADDSGAGFIGLKKPRDLKDTKIVDVDGSPLVVYHGTSAEFDDFMLPGSKTGRMTGGSAVYFSTDAKQAKAFARGESGRVIEAHVNVQKPFDFRDADDMAALEGFITKNFDSVAPGALFSPKGAVSFLRDGDFGLLEKPAVRKWMHKQGYDGYWVREGKDDPMNIAVFDPAQIHPIGPAKVKDRTASFLKDESGEGRVGIQKVEKSAQQRAETAFTRKLGADGNVIGAPAGVKTPKDEGKLAKKYIDMVVEGAAGRGWYGESGKSNLEHAGDDALKAQKFTGAQAVTSASTGVQANLGHAVRAHNQVGAGVKVQAGQYPVAMGEKITKIYSSTTPAQLAEEIGPKIGPYFENIAKGGGFNTSDMGRAVHDIWDARAWGFTNKDGSPFDGTVSPTQHRWMDQQMAKVISYLNRNKVGGLDDWTPESAQAAAWIAKKAKQEGKSIEDAAKNYSSFMEGTYGQGSYESVPGRTTDHLPGLRDEAASEARTEHMGKVYDLMTDDKGRDRIAQSFDALTGKSFKGQGFFEGKINDGAQTQVALGRATGGEEIDPASEAMMNAIEATRGLLLGQDAAAWHLPGKADAVKRAQITNFNLGGKVSDAQFLEVAQAMVKHLGSDIADSAGIVPTPNGFRLLNWGMDPGKFNAAAKKIGKEMGALSTDHVKQIGGNLISNDWKTNPLGQEYMKYIDRPEFQRAFDRIAPQLAERLNQLDATVFKTYGDLGRSEVQKVRQIIADGGYAGLMKAIGKGALTIGAVGIALNLMMMMRAGQLTEDLAERA